MKISTSFIALFALIQIPLAQAGGSSIQLTPVGSYRTGILDESAQEIVVHDKYSKRLFVTNAATSKIDVLDMRSPSSPQLLFSIDVSAHGKQANSVAVHNGLVVAAVQNQDKQANGFAVFFDSDGNFINKVTVGALPDMVTFSPNGRWVLVANEGEPNDDYSVDPEGSVSVISLRYGARYLSQGNVRSAGFSEYTRGDLDPSVRVFGPNASVAQDFEPEYITVSADSKTAWVSLQENNALAVVDIRDAEVTDVFGLGTKNHMRAENKLDASNKDGGINLHNWPVHGMYMPDTISSYRVRGRNYIVTANEGDSRDYPGFSEEERVKDLILDAVAFPNAASLQDQVNLGRLKITNTLGDVDNDGDYDQLYSYGGRSFSIWNDKGELVFDSGDDFERITADLIPEGFNSTNDENGSMDDRSDDKGPEPEALAIGKIRGHTYAFIGLERVGGIMVYDISNPYRPQFIQYLTTRDFNGNPILDTAGDLAPEGIAFINAYHSPLGVPMLAVAHEVSGSTVLYRIDRISVDGYGNDDDDDD